jgi:hypothetical protein
MTLLGKNVVSPPQEKDHFLPSRDVSYAYTVAMLFAQQFEQNLRAILYTADYHGWISELKLTEEEKARYKNAEGLIDSATCGKLIEALRKTGWIKAKKAFSVFERACQHRNRLAHSFLANHDFGSPTKEKDEELIKKLHLLSYDLYDGLVITRALRKKCEVEADKVQASLNEMAKEIGMEPLNDPDRHFVTRKVRRKK